MDIWEEDWISSWREGVIDPWIYFQRAKISGVKQGNLGGMIVIPGG